MRVWNLLRVAPFVVGICAWWAGHLGWGLVLGALAGFSVLELTWLRDRRLWWRTRSPVHGLGVYRAPIGRPSRTHLLLPGGGIVARLLTGSLLWTLDDPRWRVFACLLPLFVWHLVRGTQEYRFARRAYGEGVAGGSGTGR